MNEYLLARIAALESIIMLMWNDHPNRESIRDAARLLFDAKVSNDLASSSADIPIEIRQKAIESVLKRVFYELPTNAE